MKVNKIKEAATAVFSQKGYTEAKITDISEKANVSVGTIYANFKSKAELFESLNIPEWKEYKPEYDRKRSEILKIALSTFTESGYSGTSMEKIASRCGFTKAVLYQYFKNKEDLFSAIFQEPVIISKLDNIDFEFKNENLEDVFIKIGSMFIKMFEDEDRLNLIRIVLTESLRFPELGKIMYHNGINKVTENFSKYLKVLSEREIIQITNPKLTAKSYFGLLYSFIITDKILNSGDEEFNTEEIISYSTRLFMSGLKVKN